MANITLLKIILILCTSLSLAQENQEKDLKSIPSTTIVLQDNIIEVFADRSAHTSEKVMMRANNDTGRLQLSLVHIPIDTGNEEVKFIDAALVQDSQEIHVRPEDVKISDLSLSNSPGISSTKILSIPFAGVKTGGSVWYKIERYSKRGLRTGEFSSFFSYGNQIPEQAGITTIRSEIPLKYSVNDPDNFLSITSKSEKAPFTYEVKLNKESYAVKSTDFNNKSYQQLKKLLPNVHFTSNENWETISRLHNSFYQISDAELQLPELEKISQEALKKKFQASNIEKLLVWMAENITYSGRWLTPEAGWRPHDLKTIAQLKIADCKDFAKLFLAMAKKWNIEAEPVYVNSDGKGLRSLGALPIDEQNPLPTMNYFNHVIVRYRLNGKWITIDPGRRLGDATRLPSYLRNAWAVNLAEGSRAYKLHEEKVNYAKVLIHNTFTERIDGNFMGKAMISITGEIANYLKSIYFSEGEKALRDILGVFVPASDASAAQLTNTLMISRFSDNIDLSFDFSLQKDASEKSEGFYIYPPYFYLKLYQQTNRAQNIPDFPIEVKQESFFPGMFSPNEIADECYVRGPILALSRRIENNENGFVIKDLSTLQDTMNIPTDSERDRAVLSNNGDEIRDCLARAYVKPEKKIANSATQKSFESKIDFSKTPNVYTGNHSKELSLSLLRELDFRIKENPSDAYLLRLKSTVLADMAYLYNDYKTPQFLDESVIMLEKAVQLQPQKADYHGLLGLRYMDVQKPTEAMNSFKSGYKIDPTNFRVLQLGGVIFEKKGKLKEAEGYWLAAKSYAKEKIEKVAVGSLLIELYCNKQKNCVRSLPLHEELIAIFPDDPWLYSSAAKSYGEVGDHNKAIELLRKALKIKQFGVASENLAVELVQKSLSITNKPILPTLEELAEVEQLYIEAYKVSPKNQFVLWNIARFYMILAFASQDKKHFNTSLFYVKDFKVAYPDEKRDIADLDQAYAYYLNQPFSKVNTRKVLRAPASNSKSVAIKSASPTYFESREGTLSLNVCRQDNNKTRYDQIQKFTTPQGFNGTKCLDKGSNIFECQSDSKSKFYMYFFESKDECEKNMKEI